MRIPCLYRHQVLPLSNIINRRWYINFYRTANESPAQKCMWEDCIPGYGNQLSSLLLHRSQCTSQGCRRGSRVPAAVEAAPAMPACRYWLRRQGPLKETAVDDVTRQGICRRWARRHVPTGFGPGGRWHMSPGQTCRHPEMIFFDNFLDRWSFLRFHWRSWSLLSKIKVQA
jgi:hypothetical protein